MMEEHQPLISQDGSRRRNPSERCPCLLYSQGCPEERVLENPQMINQWEDLTDIKVEDEEEWMMGDPSCRSEVEEEIPEDFNTEKPSKNCYGNVILSLNSKAEDEDTMQRSSGETLITLNVHPGLHRTDVSYNLPNHEEPEGDKRFQCGKVFSKRSRLSTHRRILPGKKPDCCEECGKHFTKKSHLVSHERSHTEEKPYSCSECGKWFTEKSSLVRHEKSHTGEKPYSCSECGKCFIGKSYLVIHQKSHTGE
ncbi:oocyte zinc finger protein XlCOF10-like, partial [Bufo gargarizans]|uniref:oocyte zinc finger protein XlCOF10-like n=1 Tax=Bufo gargarizans TaxID=30331 RepID=UPI001CF27ADB